MPDEFSILIVDDEPNIRSGLQQGLAKEAARVVTAETADAALEQFKQSPFNLVISDVRLPGSLGGIELLDRLKHEAAETTVIVITAHGTVEMAVDAMRLGAFDFITKPIDLDLIRQQVRKAREHHLLRIENRRLRDQLAGAGELSGIIGNCAAMREVMRQVRQIAQTDATVMIHGESGTGKELIARALHDLSPRGERPMIAVNLGALPETLLESELFGHEKGAFTGAVRCKPGCFERALGGSLFLDEITEIPAKCQVDLLRVLETSQFSRIGGEQVMQSDVRLISATNRDAQQVIDDGTFREDLYYRLNIVPIQLPPLRRRTEDIPLLIEHFLHFFCQRHARPGKKMSTAAVERLVGEPWPGNIRQLRNMIERLVVTVSGDEIRAQDIPLDDKQRTTMSHQLQTLADATEAAERTAIANALAACGHHREQTATRLGISVRTLHYKMSRYSLH